MSTTEPDRGRFITWLHKHPYSEGIVTLVVLGAVARSPRWPAPFDLIDLIGQIAAVAAMGGLTHGG